MRAVDEAEAKLRKLAEAAGLTVLKCTEWHFQVHGGAVLVNWYPHSKKRSAYIAGTIAGVEFCTAAEVIKLAQGKTLTDGVRAPPMRSSKRRKALTNHKLRMMLKHPYCHWCGKRVFDPRVDGPCDPLLVATVDHVIPRSKGGLDHSNNYVLACHGCNQARRDDMPKMKEKQDA